MAPGYPAPLKAYLGIAGQTTREGELMLRRTLLTVGLLAACLWCLLLVVRATSVETAPAAETTRADHPAAPADSLM